MRQTGIPAIATVVWNLALTVGAIGATRYVATTGTDTGAGTSPEAPWRTISYAVNHAADGDTVRVQGGRYLENHYGPYGIYHEVNSGITILGCDADWNESAAPQDVYVETPEGATDSTVFLTGRVDGKSVTYRAITFVRTFGQTQVFRFVGANAAHLVLDRCAIHAAPEGSCVHAVGVQPATGGAGRRLTLNASTVECSGHAVSVTGAINAVEMTRCTLEPNRNAANAIHGFAWNAPVASLRFTDCTATYNVTATGYGLLDFRNANVASAVVSGGTWTSTATNRGGFVLNACSYAPSLRVTGATFHQSATTGQSICVAVGIDGYDNEHPVGSVSINNCRITGNNSHTVLLGSGSDGAMFADNTVISNGDLGVVVKGCNGVSVLRNRIVGVRPLYIKSARCTTVISNATCASSGGALEFLRDSGRPAPTGNRVRYNIFDASGGGFAAIWDMTGGPGQTWQNQIDSNAYVAGSAGLAKFGSDPALTSLAELQAFWATGPWPNDTASRVLDGCPYASTDPGCERFLCLRSWSLLADYHDAWNWMPGVRQRPEPVGDFDDDGDVDLADFRGFQRCFNGPNRPPLCLPVE